MFRKITLAAAAIGLVFAAIGVGAPSASAEDGTRDGTFLRGTGRLEARGDGLIAVKGRMDYKARADRGVLLVKDIAGDAEVDVQGEGDCTAEFRGFKVCFGTGEARITGSDVAVILVGNNLEVNVTGKGWAFLKGRGQYLVNGQGPFPWNPDGGFAGVGPDPGVAP